MRFWVSVVIGIVIVTGLSTALYVGNPDLSRRREQPVTVTPVDTANSPKVVAPILEETVDNVAQYKEGESVFKISNQGVGRLDLKAGKPSCTCVGVSFRKEKMTGDDSEVRIYLEPGESAEFVVGWKSEDRMGSVRVDAPVLTNDPVRKTLPFAVKLNVVPDIYQQPEYINFGTMAQGSSATRDAVMISTIQDGVEFTPDAVSERFEVKVEPLKPEEMQEAKAKSGCRVFVTAKGPFPVGDFFDAVAIKTNLQRTPVVYVRVTGEVEGQFQMTPSRIDFGTVVDKSSAERKVQIFAKGLEEDRQLVVGEVSPAFLKVTLEKDPKLKVLWRLTVQVPEDAPVGQFRGRVAVDDSTGANRLSLSVTGSVSGAGNVETARTAK